MYNARYMRTYNGAVPDNLNFVIRQLTISMEISKILVLFFAISNLQQLRPFDQSMDGYYTAVLYNRGFNSLPVVIRRFNRREDRDCFVTLLDRYGWTPLVMKKFWALTINGDPCLVVDSAAVYTWQEAVQGNLIEDTMMTRAKFYLQTYQFFQHAETDPQRRRWIYYGGKEDMGVQKLRLFSMEGNIILDPEKLELDDLIRNNYLMVRIYVDTTKKDIVYQDLREILLIDQGTVWADELMRSTVYGIHYDLFRLKFLHLVIYVGFANSCAWYCLQENMMVLYGNAWERKTHCSIDPTFLVGDDLLIRTTLVVDSAPKAVYLAILLGFHTSFIVIPAAGGESLQAKGQRGGWNEENLYQNDEDRFEDLSDHSDGDTDNEEIATDSPIMPPKPELLQTAPPSLFIESVDAMDVDD
ncbi:hypothetical protein K435DRAFT_806968 [Dendrothele bispora CBS 962.96]|uniref:Uncharacterized protein n=1 Tax=Dendrothele bispora (strain CBS 962.96) TaxID=1314807 RepID=A0A4S8L7J5_DENBC|nr:hypothetical protein K435DRAFT_806968 [Dendrothele bispora CBS 962.96]